GGAAAAPGSLPPAQAGQGQAVLRPGPAGQGVGPHACGQPAVARPQPSRCRGANGRLHPRPNLAGLGIAPGGRRLHRPPAGGAGPFSRPAAAADQPAPRRAGPGFEPGPGPGPGRLRRLVPAGGHPPARLPGRPPCSPGFPARLRRRVRRLPTGGCRRQPPDLRPGGAGGRRPALCLGARLPAAPGSGGRRGALPGRAGGGPPGRLPPAGLRDGPPLPAAAGTVPVHGGARGLTEGAGLSRLALYGSPREALALAPVVQAARAQPPLLQVTTAAVGDAAMLAEPALAALGLTTHYSLPVDLSPGAPPQQQLAHVLEAVAPCLAEQEPGVALVAGYGWTAAAAAVLGGYRRILLAHVDAGRRWYRSGRQAVRQPRRGAAGPGSAGFGPAGVGPAGVGPPDFHHRLLAAGAHIHLAATALARGNLLRAGVPPEGV